MFDLREDIPELIEPRSFIEAIIEELERGADDVCDDISDDDDSDQSEESGLRF